VSNTRVTNIDVLHLRADRSADAGFDGSYDTCIVLIEADDGNVGIGESESLPSAVRAVIDGPTAHSHAQALRDLLIGRDPSDVERIWQDLYLATDFIGRRGLVMHALGAVDLALWDLRGKIEQKPVYALLGGQVHDRVLAYGTIYPLARRADDVSRQIEAARARNLTAFKLCADPWWFDDLAHTASLLSAARRAAGDTARLIIDAALSYATAEEGLRLLPLLKDIGVWFLEAPMPLDDVEGHARIAREGIRIGVGDLGLTHVNEFVEMMDRGLADVCQPDISVVGGFVGIRKIAAATRSRKRRLIPHGYKTEITIAANLHFLASEPDDEPIMEYSLSSSPLRWETVLESFDVESDGRVRVPAKPGLGITLNRETVSRYTWPRSSS